MPRHFGSIDYGWGELGSALNVAGFMSRKIQAVT